MNLKRQFWSGKSTNLKLIKRRACSQRSVREWSVELPVAIGVIVIDGEILERGLVDEMEGGG